MSMTPDVAKRVIEGALLCANRPLAINDIRQLFDEDAAVEPDAVKALLDELSQDWQGRSVELVSLASGWRFQCAPDVAGHVLKLQPERMPRYSRAVMETLAIIAYHQPVTRGDIEEIRGVGVSAHIIKTLEDRGWIDQVGVKEVAGRPALFATTRQFLDDLNLRSLKDLPALDDGAASPGLLALAAEAVPPPVASVAIGDDAAAAPVAPVAGGEQELTTDRAVATVAEVVAEGESSPDGEAEIATEAEAAGSEAVGLEEVGAETAVAEAEKAAEAGPAASVTDVESGDRSPVEDDASALVEADRPAQARSPADEARGAADDAAPGAADHADEPEQADGGARTDASVALEDDGR